MCVQYTHQYAHQMKKYLSGNYKLSMNNGSPKVILNIARFRNMILNKPVAQNKCLFNPQRNYHVTLFRKKN